MKEYGPKTPVGQWAHATKYRGEGEDFPESMYRQAEALKDDDEHYRTYLDIIINQRFLAAGRIQSDIGSPRSTTPYNCFVSGTIEDSTESIMQKVTEAFQTMRRGGGIGYDFSNLRPRNALIASLGSRSGGPLPFMDIFNSTCGAVSSAGHRRGAQMGVLRIDHPDIEEFIGAKNNHHQLNQFNISVGVTDEFMEAVKDGTLFELRFEGRSYGKVDARSLWNKVLRSTWDWAEPGVLFLDQINRKNNLAYCETISATNPCGEQPLPPYGACLLGSFNLTKYIYEEEEGFGFDWDQFLADIPPVVRAMDNVIDVAEYPLPQQEVEAKNKRRMGLGVTGLANAGEALGYEYGSPAFLGFTRVLMTYLRDTAYRTSIQLAKEKGAFPLFDPDKYGGTFFATLPDDIQRDVRTFGLRNSHLLSIAPTGTISLSADNVSSGIEPVFSKSYDRKINTYEGERVETVEDYGYRVFGITPKTADQLRVEDHVKVLTEVSKYVDSACSKTCNVGDDVTWDEFKDVYMNAWKGGASGITTFRASGKRFGILTANADEEIIEDGEACYIDPETGERSCDSI